MKRKTAAKKKSSRNPVSSESLVIQAAGNAPLSKTQQEFNRLMKSLETTRKRHAMEQVRLDEALDISIKELMPLLESYKRADRDVVLKAVELLKSLKLSAKRRESLGELLSEKADDLISDPVGLSDDDLEKLQAIVSEFGPSEEEMDEEDEAEFEFLCDMLEQTARKAGIDLDLSDLDPNTDPAEFERTVKERLGHAQSLFEDSAASPQRPRKKTKAQLEKERKRAELEEARNRDLKSLFKQLAKAFHPDLESDPLLKVHKENWMKRLNAAYAINDLREMLQLELEWLGEEASNLATAGEEKLKVYCAVLKEQIADLKEKTRFLLSEPQYGPLQRFRDPYHGHFANPGMVKREINQELKRVRGLLETLSANNAASRRLIYEMADQHASRMDFRF